MFACSKTDRTRCIAVTTASHDCCARLDISTLEMIRSSLHCAWAAARGRPCWILGTPHLDLTVRRAARLAAMLGFGGIYLVVSMITRMRLRRNADSIGIHRREAEVLAALPPGLPVARLLGVVDQGD